MSKFNQLPMKIHTANSQFHKALYNFLVSHIVKRMAKYRKNNTNVKN